MTPTHEQIAAMEARGWVYDPADRGLFFVHGGVCNGSPIVSMSVRWINVSAYRAAGWLSLYGTIGNGADRMERHPDPLAAADEAEAWLRGVLAGLRFPWLSVKGASAAAEAREPKP